MSDEVKSNPPADDESDSAQPAPTVDIVAMPSPKISLVGDAAKIAVLVAFGLYVIGFIIWRSYLNVYGVSSVGFLQTEYLSAAFCYLVILFVLAAPTAVIIEHYRLKAKKVNSNSAT